MNKKIWVFCVLVLSLGISLPIGALGQISPLKLKSPVQDSVHVRSATTYLQGFADPSAFLFLQGEEVKIYATGVFAAALTLEEGHNAFELLYGIDGDTTKRRLVYVYERPSPPRPTAGFAIESVRLIPGGDLWLKSGDYLQIEVKASPGMDATLLNQQISLTELDSAQTGVAGIYRGEYLIKESDVSQNQTVAVLLRDPQSGKTIQKDSEQTLTVLADQPLVVGRTNKKRVGLDYGLGTDRLGGAKMGFLDSAVRLEIAGKMQGMYKVRLADQTQAYVNVRDITLEEGVNFRPHSITGSWSVTTRGGQDFVSIGLSQRLPYTTQMLDDPTKIVIDIYGAVSNSNWITQRGDLAAIKNVWYEQLNKDIFRVHLELKDKEHWGHEVYYRGNSLQIRVKPRPEKLDLRHLTIAVDAGHGGNNNGAIGMTGVKEKDLNLSMAQKLKHRLEQKGATVIMTRDDDTYTNNTQRLQALRSPEPDILISIHCNAAGNPMVAGASTYYRHQAFRPLSVSIYDEMLALDLADFGNVGGFNFTLNSPTEFPSVLVEVAFMSNPADEERLLDTEFHEEMAEAILVGLEKYLKSIE